MTSTSIYRFRLDVADAGTANGVALLCCIKAAIRQIRRWVSADTIDATIGCQPGFVAARLRQQRLGRTASLLDPSATVGFERIGTEGAPRLYDLRRYGGVTRMLQPASTLASHSRTRQVQA